jgi:hypothetical protein
LSFETPYGGYLPLSAVLTHDSFYQACYGDYAEQRAFFCIHTVILATPWLAVPHRQHRNFLSPVMC